MLFGEPHDYGETLLSTPARSTFSVECRRFVAAPAAATMSRSPRPMFRAARFRAARFHSWTHARPWTSLVVNRPHTNAQGRHAMRLRARPGLIPVSKSRVSLHHDIVLQHQCANREANTLVVISATGLRRTIAHVQRCRRPVRLTVPMGRLVERDLPPDSGAARRRRSHRPMQHGVAVHHGTYAVRIPYRGRHVPPVRVEAWIVVIEWARGTRQTWHGRGLVGRWILLTLRSRRGPAASGTPEPPHGCPVGIG